MNTATSAKLSLESDLHNALRQNEFILHYQPQIDIASRKIFGVEALIRWRHPRRGLVPPSSSYRSRKNAASSSPSANGCCAAPA